MRSNFVVLAALGSWMIACSVVSTEPADDVAQEARRCRRCDGGTEADAGTTPLDAATSPEDSGALDASSEPPPTGTTGTTYYVDPTTGSDSAAGTSEATAWRSLAKASAAALAPGDRLLFRRGGVWTGTLTLSKSGTSAAPITVGGYGDGVRPIVRQGSTCIKVTGSYLVVDGLHADDCGWAGFEIAGTHDEIRSSRATHSVAGIEIDRSGTDNRVLRSEIVDNQKMSVLTSGGDDDSGAFGILLHGDRNEIAWNTISGHDAFSYDYGRDGAAIEIYGGVGNHIHHNVASDNDAFTELGDARSSDNTFGYNVVMSALASSTFLVTRGASSSFGPVLRTRVYNNTVYLTGSSSQGFVCHAGCNADILVMRNNVIQAAWKVGYADAPFDEDYDLFFKGQLQFSRGSHSVVADPLFVSSATRDLHLSSSSPAVDTALSGLGYTVDADGRPVPISGVDRGAYER